VTEPNRLDELVGGKYRIVRFLASGGMGSVYEAQHTVVRRRFAVKFLHHELALRRELLARFQLEAEAAGALESEHVAAAVDFGIASDGAPYIVLEYLVGESLEHLLERDGCLPIERATNLVQQACRGVQAAHASGIVHRDLKPHNLFVCRREDGTDLVKVLDFGVAKLEFLEKSGAATRTGTVLGTPSYMSPEQARGEKNVDHLSDVYALGAILYELLSGKKPHPGESHNAILHHIATQPPLPLAESELPAALVAVVERALAGAASERPASAEELAVSLSPWARAEVWPAPKAEPSAPRHAEPSTTLPAPVELASAGAASVPAPESPRSSERESVAPPSGTPESIEVSRDRGSAAPERGGRSRIWLALAAAVVVAGAALVVLPAGSKHGAEPDGASSAAERVPAPSTAEALATAERRAAMLDSPLAPGPPPALVDAATTAQRAALPSSAVTAAPLRAANTAPGGAVAMHRSADGHASRASADAVSSPLPGAAVRAPSAESNGRPPGRPAAPAATEAAARHEAAEPASGLAPVRFDQHNPYTDQRP
jgi:serine/threonine-protein kinase